jgi:signal transduction histidine kinase
VDRAAEEHAEQRFWRGYDLPAIVREYGVLREILWDAITEQTEPPLEETRRLLRYLFEGLAEATARYVNLRDGEIRRRNSEHLGFLAHELRNPIASARMAMELLRVRREIDPSSQMFNVVERGITKAMQLIDDALIAVRLGQVGPQSCANVDLGAMVHDLAAESEAEASAKGLAIVVEGGGQMEADVRALRSALSNLIRNAVKFSKPKSEIVLRVRATGGRVIVEVEDSCGGLAEGAETKLFDPFVQAGADRSGFGLGLAIAKQATEAHNGQLRIHNLPGKGCVFVLDLPVGPPPREERARESR